MEDVAVRSREAARRNEGDQEKELSGEDPQA